MELSIKEKVEREKFEVILYDNNLIYYRYFKDKYIEAADVLECFEIHDSFNLKGAVKRLIHLEKDSTISSAARDEVQNNLRPTLAEAFMLPTLPQKIIFNAYNKLRKNEHPVKAFDTFEQAVEWLDSFDR